ncbi:hypothetical protein AAFF_G00320080 [Aldrovandia affinis]|uniref:Uncharacterized protein n=1 Tax=Aldrovandia affinis TaxID=143900 RepID=A0AAD7SN82_9TELE|nr:hypothetical protein AAFF_G00320080 [Aldrovandia affinis]
MYECVCVSAYHLTTNMLYGYIFLSWLLFNLFPGNQSFTPIVRGWLNDQKDTVHLILQRAPVKTTQVPVTTDQETTNSPTQAPTTTYIPITTKKETTNHPTPVPVITTEPPASSSWTTDAETTDTLATDALTQSAISSPITPTEIPVTTDQETPINPTQVPVITTEPPASSPWTTDAETTDTLATDALTQSAISSPITPTEIPVTTDQETPINPTQAITTEIPMSSSWPTDPETTDTLTTDAVTQGMWDYSTASPTLVPQNNMINEIEVWTPENSISAEKTLMHSPHLVWILCPTLLLVILMGTAFIFRKRMQQKADSFKLTQGSGSSIDLETSHLCLELEAIKAVV